MTPTTPQYPVRQFRLAAGLSLRDLEERTGINRGRLSIIERGVTPTDDEAALILAAMAAAYGEKLRTTEATG